MINPELAAAAKAYSRDQERYYAALRIYTDLFRRSVRGDLSDVELEKINTAANDVQKALADEMTSFNNYYTQLQSINQKNINLNGANHDHS